MSGRTARGKRDPFELFFEAAPAKGMLAGWNGKRRKAGNRLSGARREKRGQGTTQKYRKGGCVSIRDRSRGRFSFPFVSVPFKWLFSPPQNSTEPTLGRVYTM